MFCLQLENISRAKRTLAFPRFFLQLTFRLSVMSFLIQLSLESLEELAR